MFKKPLSNLKSFSPLRSSDRRRFRDDLLAIFPVLRDATTEEGALSLTPEGFQSAKFATHVDELGVLYIVDGNPVWVKLDKSKLIVPSGEWPTYSSEFMITSNTNVSLQHVAKVYTLWQYPNMLPKIITWGPVVGKLMGGAGE